jgi:hypothetical protein
VLWFANIQNALHVVNHLADADEAHPLWLGMANIWALLVTGVILAVLLIASFRTSARADQAAAGAESGGR